MNKHGSRLANSSIEGWSQSWKCKWATYWPGGAFNFKRQRNFKNINWLRRTIVCFVICFSASICLMCCSYSCWTLTSKQRTADAFHASYWFPGNCVEALQTNCSRQMHIHSHPFSPTNWGLGFDLISPKTPEPSIQALVLRKLRNKKKIFTSGQSPHSANKIWKICSHSAASTSKHTHTQSVTHTQPNEHNIAARYYTCLIHFPALFCFVTHKSSCRFCTYKTCASP